MSDKNNQYLYTRSESEVFRNRELRVKFTYIEIPLSWSE